MRARVEKDIVFLVLLLGSLFFYRFLFFLFFFLFFLLFFFLSFFFFFFFLFLFFLSLFFLLLMLMSSMIMSFFSLFLCAVKIRLRKPVQSCEFINKQERGRNVKGDRIEIDINIELD